VEAACLLLHGQHAEQQEQADHHGQHELDQSRACGPMPWWGTKSHHACSASSTRNA
jgi:hypothetical protein